MKIGDQVVHHPELKSGIDEEVAFACHGPNSPLFVGGKFKGSNRGCPHRPDPASRRFHPVDFFSRGR